MTVKPVLERERTTPPEPPDLDVSRRSVLRRIGLGGVTTLVAGTGVLSYRVFDNGVLDPGSGTPYDAWSHWRDYPTPLGAVGAAILAANPHNTQPWVFRVAVGQTPRRSRLRGGDPGRTGTRSGHAQPG